MDLIAFIQSPGAPYRFSNDTPLNFVSTFVSSGRCRTVAAPPGHVLTCHGDANPRETGDIRSGERSGSLSSGVQGPHRETLGLARTTRSNRHTLRRGRANLRAAAELCPLVTKLNITADAFIHVALFSPLIGSERPGTSSTTPPKGRSASGELTQDQSCGVASVKSVASVVDSVERDWVGPTR
jgi:hypothetical protein